jgi:tRNA (cmo5U34)-methyltransferase
MSHVLSMGTMNGRHFSDPATIASYVERTRRAVPGLDVMHRIVDQILSENTPDDGRILVVGAGGGLELRHLAMCHPGWSFEGVDPSPPMLALARETIGPSASRVTLHEGDASCAPEGPFDGATCLLVLHFLGDEERLATLGEIQRRLRPGAPLLTFNHASSDGPDRLAWFQRSARFAAAPETSAAELVRSAAAMSAQLPARSPREEEALLRGAGFRDVGLYYAALTFRGWVAYA